ncbi:MAG: endonuclease [Bacteroidota bacterium]
MNMRFRFSLLILLLVSVVAVAQEKGKTQKKFQVALIGFYNLENFYDTINDPGKNDEEFLPGGANHYTGAVYLDKISKLSDVISLIGTDVTPDGLALMGCAEIENDTVLTDLTHSPKLVGRGYKIVHYNSPDIRGIDVGLLYNPKYFTPKFSEPLFVPLIDPDGAPRYTRDVLYVEGTFLGESIFVFVNHWPSRRGGEEASAPGRALAASVAKHKIDSITKINPDAKIVLMGDLNDDPVSPSLTKVIGALGERKDVQRGGMFNPWMVYYKQGIGTLAYNDSWNLFDQIVISSGWLNKDRPGLFFKEARIFSKPWMIQQDGRYKGYPKRTYDFNKYIGGYSDHFPTFTVFLKEKK